MLSCVICLYIPIILYNLSQTALRKSSTPTTRLDRGWYRKHIGYLLFSIHIPNLSIFLCDRDFHNSQDINYILFCILIDWVFHICFPYVKS